MFGRRRSVKAGEPVLVTIPNVPILSTGIDYEALTGTFTFTEEDMRSFVESQGDPAIAAPRLKLSRGQVHDENGFNEPAFGRVTNLHLGDNGQTVYGDYVGVPKWLADILPIAYPNRSIEGEYGVETVTGKRWPLVVKAVELLGVHWPGCSVLEDLPLMYGDTIPDEVELSTSIAAALASGGDPKMKQKIRAAVDVDEVRRQFYDELEPDQYWWWIRAIRLSPNELIIDDDDGHLYRVPFSVKGEKITFSEAIEVKITYTDVAAAASKEEKHSMTALVTAGLLSAEADEPLAVFASRDQSRPVVLATQEGGEVDLEALRELLGMPEGTTSEQVVAEIDRLRTLSPAPAITDAAPGNNVMPEQDPNRANPAPEGGTAVVGDQDPANPSQPGAFRPNPNTHGDLPALSADDDGMVKIDRATLEALQRGAAAGTRVESQMLESEDDRILASAISDGKIPPARREHYKTAMSSDREGTRKLLAEMPSGLVPVEMRGNPQPVAGNNETVTDELGGGLPGAWFPEIERNRVAAAAAAAAGPGAGTVTKAKEG